MLFSSLPYAYLLFIFYPVNRVTNNNYLHKLNACHENCGLLIEPHFKQ